jgi:hypothetical protein
MEDEVFALEKYVLVEQVGVEVRTRICCKQNYTDANTATNVLVSMMGEDPGIAI